MVVFSLDSGTLVLGVVAMVPLRNLLPLKCRPTMIMVTPWLSPVPPHHLHPELLLPRIHVLTSQAQKDSAIHSVLRLGNLASFLHNIIFLSLPRA